MGNYTPSESACLARSMHGVSAESVPIPNTADTRALNRPEFVAGLDNVVMLISSGGNRGTRPGQFRTDSALRRISRPYLWYRGFAPASSRAESLRHGGPARMCRPLGGPAPGDLRIKIGWDDYRHSGWHL